MDKRFWAIIGVIIAIFVGVMLLSGNEKADAPSDGKTDSKGSQHVLGAGTKGVTLTEYGDFQCPVCRDFHPTVKQVIEKYGDDIKFEFKHYPLTSIHKNAFAASRATEAAHLQGKFWEMHDMLYQNHAAWAEASGAPGIFQNYATQLGLDVDKFKKDFASSSVNSIVNADIAEFNSKGLRKSTPTFLLNGKKVEPRSLDQFHELIDAEIAKQNQ